MFKTILVHVDGGAGQPGRLHAAALLARSHDAHLVGCAATGLPAAELALMTGTMGVPILTSDIDALRDRALRCLRDFEAEAARLGVRAVAGRVVHDSAACGLLLASRFADLVVVSRDDGVGAAPDSSASPRGLPGRLAPQGVRPVLVVPPAYAGAAPTGTAVVGYDGSREATRAIDGALPLLRQASSVKLVMVNPGEAGCGSPGADMAGYLRRHGVAVEVVAERTGTRAGAALLALAGGCGAGLIVSGAWGHGRLHEWILGGVTRELLARAPVPLLIAH